MATTFKLRRDTAANWTANNPILADGEPGVEKDTAKLKFGDGNSQWNALPYTSSGGSGNGTPGESAYQLAVDNGFVGTIDDWFNSLTGDPGTDGQPGRLTEATQFADGTWNVRAAFSTDPNVRVYWMWEIAGSEKPPVGGDYAQITIPKDVLYDLR